MQGAGEDIFLGAVLKGIKRKPPNSETAAAQQHEVLFGKCHQTLNTRVTLAL